MKKIVVILCLLLPFFVQGQIIVTIAGNGTIANTGDGYQATAAGIDLPAGCIFDKFGNFYLTTDDAGNLIRKITPGGIISTVAGTSAGGFSGDNGPATAAKLKGPQLIAVDTEGNFYFSDAVNERIRKVDIATGIITTIAGTGAMGYFGDAVPATTAVFYSPNGVCFDKKGNLYVDDYFNSRVRKINTAGIISNFAGTGVAGYNGDGGLADTSEIRGSFGICSDDIGNIYIADESDGRIRKVDTFGIIHTIAGIGVAGNSGDGASSLIAEVEPHCITYDKFGNIYFGDIYTNTVRKINSTGIITTIAGNGTLGYLGDNGPATAAEFHDPFGVTTDTCGNLYICDGNNYRIRKVTFPPITTATPVISLTASTGDTVCSGTSVTYHATVSGGGASFTYQWYVNGVAVSSTGTSYTYTPASGDSVACMVTTTANACAIPAVATSHAIHMVVNPFVTPTISIAASPSDTVCAGTSVTYTATITSGGAAPAYQWYVNGVAVISGSSSYTYTPSNGDVVSCTLTSSNPCAIPLSATNSMVMVVRPVVTPTISISLVPADSIICSGTAVVFTASVSNGGSAPSYQWKVNGTIADTTPSYTYTPANGDSIRCILTSSAECAVPATVSSSTINMVVDTFITPTITLSGITSDPIGGTVTVNATVADAGSSYLIYWFNNGIEFATTTVPTVTYTKDAAADTITALIVPTGYRCYDSATSAGFIVTAAQTGVKPLPPKGEPSIWPNPAKDELHIDYGANCIMSVTINNLLGQAVISKEYNTGQVKMNIATLPAGVYVVKVNNYFVQKLVKE